MLTKHGKLFTDNFGIIFENYVCKVLQHSISTEKLISEKEIRKSYPSSKGKAVDWVIIDGDNVILIECKATRINRKTLTQDDEDTLKEKFSNIPKDLDILITHDPPTLGKVGTINQGYNAGYNAGNQELSNAIEDTWPRLVISGHIHTGNHDLDEVHCDSSNGRVRWCTTKFTNVSLLNENYSPVFKPAYFNFDVDHEVKFLETNN